MPYSPFNPDLSAVASPMDETEEERLARLLRARGPRPPAALDLASAPTPDTPPLSLSTPMARPAEEPPAALPTLAQDRLARPVPQLSPVQQATRPLTNPTEIEPTSPTVGPPMEEQQLTRPGAHWRDELTESPLTAAQPPTTMAQPGAAPVTPARRLPVSVRDEVGAMPDRGAERYQYTGHGPVGRLKAGFSNVVNAPPIQASGGSSGMVAGEALGGLLGRFIGGVVRPQSAGEYKYQKDLALWQQRQEAASKAATEESNRGDAYMRATGLDLDGNPLFGTVTKRMVAENQAKHWEGLRDAAQMRGEIGLRNLDRKSLNDIFKSLESGAFEPTDDLKRQLEARTGMTFTGVAGKGTFRAVSRWTDDHGRKHEAQYLVDKNGHAKPIMIDGETEGNAEGASIYAPFTPEAGPSQKQAPAQSAAPQNVAPGRPLENTSASKTDIADNAPYGGFKSREQALGQHSGFVANFKSTRNAWQREQAHEADLAQQQWHHAKKEPVGEGVAEQAAHKTWENRGKILDTEREKQRERVAKYEDALSKIEADVHSKFDEIGGGKFIHWNDGEHSGWLTNEKALDAAKPVGRPAYPMPGGEKTRHTGKLPPRGVKVGEGTMFPNAQP